MRKRILAIIGTRPEVIKMAPVIKRLREEDWAEVSIVATEQHKELLHQMLDVFGLKPDVNLSLMRENQTLSELTSKAVTELDRVILTHKPQLVIAQGDTTTAMCASLVSFYNRVPFAHVEAGLRSGDLTNPFPEELNRIIADRVASFNFAPTERAKNNLLKEGVPEETIFVTGNTVIDALLFTVKRVKDLNLPRVEELVKKGKKLILVTLHRRESFGKPLENICKALKRIAEERKDVLIVYPVHPNPNVRKVAFGVLSGLENVKLIEPLDYEEFVALLDRSYLVITDSGGIQEEAPALGKPVLVVRDTTERPEAVESGVAKLVGRQEEKIIEEVYRLLDDERVYRSMAKGVSPFGDGKASERIVRILKERL